MTTDPGRQDYKSSWLAGLAVTLLHCGVVAFVPDRISPLWFLLPVLAVFVWLAAARRIVFELPLCLATVCFVLMGDPAVAFPVGAWGCCVPLLLLARRERRPLVLAAWGLWTGMMSAAGIYTWLWHCISTFFQMGLLSALPLFLALVFAIGAQFAVFLPLAGFVCRRVRLPFAVTGPLLYLVVEFWMPLPLPMALGLGFTRFPILLQPADIGGLAGLSLLAAAVSGGLYEAVEMTLQRNFKRAALGVAAAAAVIAIHVGYGAWCLRQYAPGPGAPELDVAMIQPMSPARVMNTDTPLQEKLAANLIALSLRVCAEGGRRPDVLVWPEASGPFASRTPEFNPAFMKAVRTVQEATSVPLVTNDIEFVRMPDGGALRYFNTISVVEPVGTVTGSYRKNLLMPFGEFLPLERELPILRRWFSQARSILAGSNPAPLDGPGGRFAPLVCFEVLYPDYVRRLASQGCGYIVNLTNDHWYGASQQPRQHLVFAVLRAIENRKPLVRATNSGISALIDARGVIAPGKRTEPMTEATLRGVIHPRAGQTLYGRYGDAVPRFVLTPLAALLGAMSLVRWWTGRRMVGAPIPQRAKPDVRRRRRK